MLYLGEVCLLGRELRKKERENKEKKSKELLVRRDQTELIICFTHSLTHTHTHTHTHTCWFLWFMGTLHRRNGFYTEQTVCAIALHLPYT